MSLIGFQFYVNGWNHMGNVAMENIHDLEPGVLCFNPGTYHFE